MYTSIYIKEHNVFLLLLLGFVCSPVFGKQVKILYNVQQPLKKKKKRKQTKNAIQCCKGKEERDTLMEKVRIFLSALINSLIRANKRTHEHIHTYIAIYTYRYLFFLFIMKSTKHNTQQGKKAHKRKKKTAIKTV